MPVLDGWCDVTGRVVGQVGRRQAQSGGDCAVQVGRDSLKNDCVQIDDTVLAAARLLQAQKKRTNEGNREN